jgi:hypothetical protein
MTWGQMTWGQTIRGQTTRSQMTPEPDDPGPSDPGPDAPAADSVLCRPRLDDPGLVDGPAPAAVRLPTPYLRGRPAARKARRRQRDVSVDQWRRLPLRRHCRAVSQKCFINLPDRVPTAVSPDGNANTAPVSYSATTPSTSPALARSRKSRARSSGFAGFSRAQAKSRVMIASIRTPDCSRWQSSHQGLTFAATFRR